MGLYLVVSFVGIQFAAASRCALTKFSYSSFGVPFSVFSCSVSILFLNSNTYLSLISVVKKVPVIVCGGRYTKKMYSNNMLNFQEFTTILNAYTKKKSGTLLNAPDTSLMFKDQRGQECDITWGTQGNTPIF